MTAIAWLRREMRIHDNTALRTAADEHDEVVPFYVVDDDYFREKELGYPRVRFWHDALLKLRQRLEERGSRLVVQQGAPVEELAAVVEAVDADAVFVNRDYTPYAQARDEQAADAVDVPVRSVKDLAMFDRDDILTNEGTPYKVYSYYRDKWFEKEKRTPEETPAFVTPDVAAGTVPSLDDLGFERPDGLEWVWTPGRDGGLQRLDAFSDRIGRYAELRDYPGEDVTSRLSPHLKFGTVSVREAFEAAEEALDAGADEDGVRTWQEELAWRDFYFQVLWHWPETTEKAFLEKYRGINWNSKEQANRRWERWVNGKTGYPFVDAGMRQLRSTGWMHNRLRMVVTSFACKDLWLDWRDVHRYFERMFVDAEVAAMVGGIQWAYSIGTDAQPYFRVFNPWTQGEDYDPDGEYIREWVPELSDVPDEHIHRPHEMSEDVQQSADCVIGEDYPEPVVDHDEMRKEAVERFEAAED
ncbi:MAG: deoxyribodipyrimidine photo-lyase [Candidatus Nanohaloarchaea archaeon]|nr:deoxyribodipyrimidine photo-lyase [Candidatus Nanohaloarchaea archaeon]